MHDDVLGDARQPALRGMEHLLNVMDALGVAIEKLGGDAHAIAGMQFAHIGDVGFKREEGAVGGLHQI